MKFALITAVASLLSPAGLFAAQTLKIDLHLEALGQAFHNEIIMNDGNTATLKYAVPGTDEKQEDPIEKNYLEVNVNPTLTPEGHARISLVMKNGSEVITRSIILTNLGEQVNLSLNSDDGGVNIKFIATKFDR